MPIRSMCTVALLACFSLSFSSLNRAQQTPASPPEADKSADAPAADPKKVDAIVVQGQFLNPGAESAMKLAVPIKDTPLSVSNYSDDFMKALETSNLGDLYQYMTGVTRGGQSAWDLSLRGFKTTSNDRNAIMTEGLPGQLARFGSPSTVAIDHVEVVKGPASVLYGQAQPGGFVNLILKKPKEDFEGAVNLKGSTYWGDKLSFGNNPGYSVDADITGPIDNKRKFLYRVIAEDYDRETFRDFSHDKSRYAHVGLTWNIATATFATVIAEYRWRRWSQDFYIPAPNREASRLPPITTRLQEPTDFQREEAHGATAIFSHTFANKVIWKLSARSIRNDDYGKWYDPIAVLPDNVTLQRRARIGHNQRTTDYVDSTFTIPFQTGFVKHQVLVGLTGGKDQLDANRIQFVNGATTGPLARPGPGSLNINIYNPIYGLSPSHESLPSGQLQRRVTYTKAFGAYISDFVTLSDHWKATVGLRYAREQQSFLERIPVLLPERKKTLSDSYPMAGILYQPNKEWTFYGSYATSFVPAAPNFQDASGQSNFEPERGTQFEIGSKVELLKGRLYMTLALFDIKKENTLALVTCNPGIAGTCMQEVGEETSRGLEFEMSYRPTLNWQLVAGYARVDAKIAKTGPGATAPLVGSQLTNAPLHKASMWSRYDFASGALKGLGIGLGLIYVSEQDGNLPTTGNSRVLVLPSYITADLAFYYKYRRCDFTLKIGNVFDKLYYDSVGSTLADVSVVPGAPRNVTLSMRIPF